MTDNTIEQKTASVKRDGILYHIILTNDRLSVSTYKPNLYHLNAPTFESNDPSDNEYRNWVALLEDEIIEQNKRVANWQSFRNGEGRWFKVKVTSTTHLGHGYYVGQQVWARKGSHDDSDTYRVYVGSGYATRILSVDKMKQSVKTLRGKDNKPMYATDKQNEDIERSYEYALYD